MSLPFLETIGLSLKETELYELLLKRGEVPAQTLIKETGLKRATAYKTLYALEKRGLVSHRDVGKITNFRPEPPSHLLGVAEAKLQAQERAREDLRRLLPELTSAYTLSVEKPVISSFEGIEGIKKIYEDIIAEKKDILLLRSLYDERPELGKLVQAQIHRQVAAGIHTRTITPLVESTKRTYEQLDPKRLVTRHVVVKDDFSLPAQFVVYGSKVAIISLKKAIIVTLIDNPDISESFRKLFELLWKASEGEHREITKDWKQA